MGGRRRRPYCCHLTEGETGSENVLFLKDIQRPGGQDGNLNPGLWTLGSVLLDDTMQPLAGSWARSDPGCGRLWAEDSSLTSLYAPLLALAGVGGHTFFPWNPRLLPLLHSSPPPSLSCPSLAHSSPEPLTFLAGPIPLPHPRCSSSLCNLASASTSPLTVPSLPNTAPSPWATRLLSVLSVFLTCPERWCSSGPV